MDKNKPIVIQESDKIQTVELTTEDSIKFNEFIIDIDLIKKLPVNSKLTATDFDDTVHLSILDYDKSYLDNIIYIKCSIKANGKFVILDLNITEPVKVIEPAEPTKPPIQDTRISTQAIDGILAEISKLKSRLETIEQDNKSLNNKIGVDNVRIVKLEDKLSSTDKDVADLKTAIQQDYKFYTHHLKNLDERAERHNNRLGVIENKLSI